MTQIERTFYPKNILVTGGAGFIGANFVHWVHTAHPETRLSVIDNLTYAGNMESLRNIPPSNFRFIGGDICNAQLINSLFEKKLYDLSGSVLPPIDTIVHFAAESHNDNSILEAQPFIRTNVEGTFVLLEAARHYNIRFHHISTDEVYGDFDFDTTKKFTETSPYKPSSPYSATKAASDHLVRAWYRTYGVRATISNCSNNYGAYQHVEKFIPRQITNILSSLRPKLYGAGMEIRDWIHVEDHCRAIWEVVTKGTLGETYLIGSNGEHTNAEVLRIILECMGQPENNFDFVHNRPGVDKRYAIDFTKIAQELGWKPIHTDFRQGIQETVKWYRENQEWWKPSKARTEERYSQTGH